MTDRGEPTIGTTFAYGSGQTIGYTGSVAFSGRSLSLAASAIRARLEPYQGEQLGVFVESPLLLLATLLALQSRGARAVLLPHLQPAFIEEIRQDCAALVIQGTGNDPSVLRLPDLGTLISEGRPRGELMCEWHSPIGVMTSGSSGSPTCTFKTPVELASEIQMLESAFGRMIDADRVFCGSTSHQHLFGFTFRVLWPFLSGRPLADTQIRIPGDVDKAIRTHGKIVLITSPAFLQRSQELFGFQHLEESRLIGFSSGGPLPAATAMNFNQRPQVTLIEIYGSTETGALASRITDHRADTLWQPLPGVEVKANDGLLSIRAEHVSRQEPLTTEDRVEFYPEGFRLLGRRDKIVKVADKRVSLTELENLLNNHPQILEARVIQLQTGILAAVMVPAPDAWVEIEQDGKASFCRRMRNHLGESVERVTTPKRWRCLKRIPRNTQGKVELATLEAFFSTPVPAPTWNVMDASATRWTGRAIIDPSLPALEGHFPDHPIVAGVVQLAWAAECATKAFQLNELSGAMEAVKFMNPIIPTVEVFMSLSVDDAKTKVQFKLTGQDAVFSSGRLVVSDR